MICALRAIAMRPQFHPRPATRPSVRQKETNDSNDRISIPGSHFHDQRLPNSSEKLPPTREIVAGHEQIFASGSIHTDRIAFFPVINGRLTNG